MVPVRTQTPNEPSLGADAYVLLGLALTPREEVDPINLEEPISSGYPARLGLTWRNPSGWQAQPG